MHIDAVIFDWAGTTIDYGCFAPVQAFVDAFAFYHLAPTIEAIRAPMGLAKRDHIRTLLETPDLRAAFHKIYQRPFNEADIDIINHTFETSLLANLHRFATPKPGVLECVEALRARGIRIGSTTGYTDKMMAIVTREAARQGYKPDCWFSPDSTNRIGRPYPYMIFRNMEALHLQDVRRIIKIGDTLSDIQEGKNSGVITLGLIEGSSELGLTQTEYEALPPTERTARCEKVRQTYLAAGADATLQTLADLIPFITQ